jgi:hypothetical protein
MSGMLQTEFAFTLPCGYIDSNGNRHQDGIMRLATALDEVEPLQDRRVQANQAYLGIAVLSRVILRLGGIAPVSTAVVEALFAADFAYLQGLYVRLNEPGPNVIETACPNCGAGFALDVSSVAMDGAAFPSA